MYATLGTKVLGDEPARPPKRRSMSKEDDHKLCVRLDQLCQPWLDGEGARRTRDKRGMALFRGESLSDGLTTQTKLMLSSQSTLQLADRVCGDVLRGVPEPEIEATNPDDDEAARIAQGAVRTNWRNTRTLEKARNGYELSMFTGPVGFYHYWRHEAMLGIGDVDKELIPRHRLIFDDTVSYVQDMQVVGFEKEWTRAKLITLFPNKAEEIEAAGNAAENRLANLSNDPLKPPTSGGGLGSAVVDRLVTQAATNTPPYSPVTSIKNASGKRTADPLSEKVRVRFLWVDDPTPKMEKRPRLDPKTHRPVHRLVRDQMGKPVMDEDGFEVLDTPLGPQYAPKMTPKYELVYDDTIVRKYKHRRHCVYIVQDKIKLWDVSWEGPIPISILRDRYPAYGFDAPGTALRCQTLEVSRNVLWTIIFQRLKKSLAGTWIASAQSGLKRNQLVNDIGALFTVNVPDVNAAVKEFPMNPLDAANFQLLDKLENEMENLMGVTPMMRGQAVGRADSPQTYEQIADQSGGPILDRAKLVDYWVHDAVEIDLWFMQNRYTHEHTVEVELEDGFSTWVEASALLLAGKFAVRVETGATLGRSVERDRAEAQEGAQAGFYALPMLGRLGRYRAWRQGLKQKGAIMAKGPQYSWLLGASGAPPSTQAMNLRQQAGKRSHHKPGGK